MQSDSGRLWALAREPEVLWRRISINSRGCSMDRGSNGAVSASRSVPQPGLVAGCNRTKLLQRWSSTSTHNVFSTTRRSKGLFGGGPLQHWDGCWFSFASLASAAQHQPPMRQRRSNRRSQHMGATCRMSWGYPPRRQCNIARLPQLSYPNTSVLDPSIWPNCGRDVIQFVLQQSARLSPPRAKAATIALRSFLRYVRYYGGTLVDLAGAVPTVANWSMTAIPRAIAPDHLRAVLAGCRRDTPVGRRDYAILMLLARLGLRSSEIVSLTLDSIDWEAGSIAVIGKAGHAAVLPLPAEVGEAVAQYLQSDRPTCACRALFLRAHAPIRDSEQARLSARSSVRRLSELA